MDGAAILLVLAVAGVISVFFFAVKGLLDQVPDVIDSAGRVRDAWRRFRRPNASSSRGDGGEPPAGT